MVEGLGSRDAALVRQLDGTIQQLAPRWFVVRDAHRDEGSMLVHPRQTLSFLRGPMTRAELRAARAARG